MEQHELTRNNLQQLRSNLKRPAMSKKQPTTTRNNTQQAILQICILI